MKKNSTKGYAALGILLVMVSVIVFSVPTEKTAALWISYAFSVAAFAAQIVIWKAALGRETTLKSKFLGFPVLHIGTVYLIVQLAALAVFLCVPGLPAWSAVVAGTVIVGVSAVCMLAADVGRGEVERVEAGVQKKVFYIKALQADVELLAERETEPETKAALNQLAEKVRFSDPMSHEQLAELEEQITTMVSQLETAENKAVLIAKIGLLLDERNKKCKILK